MKAGAPVTLAIGRVSELYPRAAELKLTPAEARRAGAFKASGRRKQYLAGRWLLRQLCASTVAGAPADWSLSAEGLPVAWHRSGYLAPRLSLAHSGDWIAATACMGRASGVDLEMLGKKRDWVALLRHQGRKIPATGREAAFLRYWTAHEAQLKGGRPAPVRYVGTRLWVAALQVELGQSLQLRFIGRPPGAWHMGS